MSETQNTQAKPKKGLGKFLSSLILEESENVQEVKAEQPAPTVQTPTVTPTPQQTYNPNVVGVVNPEIYAMLKQVLVECNLPGPDYLELKNAFDAMKAFLPDESQRFVAAFASLKATSPKLTKKIVLDSIDEYVKFVEKERATSENEFKSMYDVEVTSKQTLIDEKNTEIQKLKDIITQSQENILKLSQEINTTSGEMLTKQNELDIKKKNFDVTIDAIIGELNSDKNKIQTLIQE